MVAAAAAEMLAMGLLLGAAASADGVPVLILRINQLSIKVGATIQVRRTTIPGTWSPPICKEEMEADDSRWGGAGGKAKATESAHERKSGAKERLKREELERWR